jgi:hypothetical protein
MKHHVRLLLVVVVLFPMVGVCGVKYIEVIDEENGQFELVDSATNVTNQLLSAELSWALDRSDQLYGMDGKYSPMYTGRNVDVFVVDGGMDPDRFNLTESVNFIEGLGDCPSTAHGNAMAAVIGGGEEGISVAPAVRLFALRVFNCEGVGYLFDLLQALEWIIAHHGKRRRRGIVNLSLTTGGNDLLDRMIMKLIRKTGFTVVAAAGNRFGDDACRYSPARVGAVITVGSINSAGQVSEFSNIGKCVDVYAPGEKVPTTSQDGGGLRTGTSIATALTTGILATWLERGKLPPIQAWSRFTGGGGALRVPFVQRRLQQTQTSVHDLIGFQIWDPQLQGKPAASWRFSGDFTIPGNGVLIRDWSGADVRVQVSSDDPTLALVTFQHQQELNSFPIAIHNSTVLTVKYRVPRLHVSFVASEVFMIPVVMNVRHLAVAVKGSFQVECGPLPRSRVRNRGRRRV